MRRRTSKPARRFAALPNTMKSCTFDWPAVAHAHAVLARACALKSLTFHFIMKNMVHNKKYGSMDLLLELLLELLLKLLLVLLLLLLLYVFIT